MKNKKIISVLVVCFLMVSIISITAFASSHQGKGSRAGTSYVSCTMKDCNLDYEHAHDSYDTHDSHYTNNTDDNQSHHSTGRHH